MNPVNHAELYWSIILLGWCIYVALNPSVVSLADMHYIAEKNPEQSPCQVGLVDKSF